MYVSIYVSLSLSMYLSLCIYLRLMHAKSTELAGNNVSKETYMCQKRPICVHRTGRELPRAETEGTCSQAGRRGGGPAHINRSDPRHRPQISASGYSERAGEAEFAAKRSTNISGEQRSRYRTKLLYYLTKVLCVLTLYGKNTRALIFQNFCQAPQMACLSRWRTWPWRPK
jgi:hypothetical protein